MLHLNRNCKTDMNTLTIRSPIDDQPVGTVPAYSRRDVDRVLRAAVSAQTAWADRPLADRTRIVRAAAAELRRDVKELARLLTVEVGKTPRDARDEVLRTADLIAATATEAARLKPETNRSEDFPKSKPGRTQTVVRVPWGTVLAIGPFNYPVNLTASKIAPALAMGNAVVLKPSTQGSVTGLRVARAFHRAGVPKALLPVITGSGSEIGDYLVAHDGIDAVAMTGSTAVGHHIAEKVGLVPLLMELGGNDPAIVLADADLDLAAECVVKGAFRYTGQRCTAVKRVYVIDQVADRLVGRIVERTVTQFGSAGDPRQNPIGPVINDPQAQYLESLIKDAVKRGGKILCGGGRDGRYVPATVVDRVPHRARLVHEEQFGPVLPIVRVKTVDEALKLANDTNYGLQASVFTKNKKQAERFGAELQAGGVHLNGPDQRGPDNFLFTGLKDSGLGAQGIRYTLEAMSRPKGIVHNRALVRAGVRAR